jgi:hypothetical protein
MSINVNQDPNNSEVSIINDATVVKYTVWYGQISTIYSKQVVFSKK